MSNKINTNKMLPIMSIAALLICNAGCGSSSPECADNEIKQQVIDVASSYVITNTQLSNIITSEEAPNTPLFFTYQDLLTTIENCTKFKEHAIKEDCENANKVVNMIDEKAKNFKYDLSNIRTENIDKELKKCECKATFNMNNNNYEINYKAQLNDKKEVYVEVMRF